MQRTFDFHRADRNGVIHDAVLRAGQTTAQNQKTVLRILHGFGDQCFPSIKTIAAAEQVVGRDGTRRPAMSTRTVQRAIADLFDQGILCVDLKKSDASKFVCNHYRIVWSQLAITCPKNRQTTTRPPVAARHQSATRSPSAFEPGSDTPTRASDTPTRASDTPTRASDTPTVTPSLISYRDLDPRSAPPNPPRRNQAAAADFEIFRSMLREVGVERIETASAAAVGRGLTPLQLADAIGIATRNRGRFSDHRAALVAWIRSGDWPAPVRTGGDYVGDRPRLPSRTVEPPGERPAVPLLQQLREKLKPCSPTNGDA